MGVKAVGEPAGWPWPAALAVAFAGVAAWLVVWGRDLLAAGATAASAISLGFSALRRAPASAFADAVAERTVDGAILGAVAWAGRDDPVVLAASLAALTTGYLASYLRVKATGLGFPIPEIVAARWARLGAIIAAVALNGNPIPLLAAAAISSGDAARASLSMRGRFEPQERTGSAEWADQ